MTTEINPSANKTDVNTFLKDTGAYGSESRYGSEQAILYFNTEIDAESARGMNGIYSGLPKEETPVVKEEK